MTDVTGRMFISYRRSPGRPAGDEEGQLLRDALRERGVPTWLDRDDHGSRPTEDNIRSVLQRDDTAGAVMLLSPETKDSPMIRKIECAAILRRFEQDDDFIVQPVLIGLDYPDVASVVGNCGSLLELGNLDIHKVDGNALDEDGAREIAKRVLRHRLKMIGQRSSQSGHGIGLYSRRKAFGSGLSLCHNVSHHFTGRDAIHDAYDKIEAGLYDAASCLSSTAQMIRVEAQGSAALPLGVLFGAVYSRFVYDLTWKQDCPDGTQCGWKMLPGTGGGDVVVRVSPGTPESGDLVLALSINQRVDAAVAGYLATNDIAVRSTVSIGLNEGPLGPGDPHLSADRGRAIVGKVIRSLRNAVDDLGMEQANVHVFASCPLAMAVMIGHHLNTFGKCVLYEHLPDRHPCYARVHEFAPSGFTYH